jgi:hypothetical protein
MMLADELLAAFEAGDANDDGLLSMTEAMTLNSGLTTSDFESLDTDADGFLSEAELEAQNTPEAGGCVFSGGGAASKAKEHITDFFLLGMAMLTLLALGRSRAIVDS